MKSVIFLPAVAAMLVLIGVTLAADPKKDPPAGTPGAPTGTGDKATPGAAGASDQARFYLKDGSVITGKLALKEIRMETPYGPLTVPINDIRGFTPGLESHPEVQAKLDTLVEKLGSTEFADREAAQKDLVKMGLPIRRELQGRLKDDADAERRTRLQAIIEEIGEPDEEEEADAMKQPWQRKDVLQTTDFTIAGKVTPRQFDLTSTYGTLAIKISDIRRVQRITDTREDVHKTLEIDGTCFAPNSLKNSNVRVEKGDQIVITADGQLTMTPWGNNSISTPDGAPNFGWYVPNQIPGGALVMRIGKDGPVVKVGTKATIKADRTGVLMFGIGIMPEYLNQNFPGQYNAKITVKPKA
jgi:hypothetical protein